MKKWIAISLIVIISHSNRLHADVDQVKLNIRHPVRKVRVAVIDTGISKELMSSSSLCPYGHEDFTNTGLHDTHGHGTHISGIIDQYAKNFMIGKDGGGEALEKVKLPEYCQIIIKYFDPKTKDQDPLVNTIKALRLAIDMKVDIINYSGGGTVPDEREKKLILEALSKGIKVVAAAGNESYSLDKRGYYPASYDKRIYIVGNLVDTHSRRIASSSNYGSKVNAWEVGTNILSRLPNNLFGVMTGTSQSTAVKSGKLVREMLKSK